MWKYLSCQGQIWNKLEFSNNGKLILISTDSAEHYVLDSYLGELLAVVRLAIGVLLVIIGCHSNTLTLGVVPFLRVGSTCW